MIIAIDGPAGAGKSTVAKALARRIGLIYLDTGAMYRAVTCLALERGIRPGDEGALAKLAKESTISFANEYMGIYSDIYINDERVTDKIRSPEVDRAVSIVSAEKAVRREMVKVQRRLVGDNAVVEGRDIGTVVFPDAAVKIYLTASKTERARRRRLDQEAGGHKTDRGTVEAGISARDHLDSTREVSPLMKASDAVEINSTGKSVDEIVVMIMTLVKSR